MHFANFDKNVLLSGGWDNNVFLWDVRTYKPIGNFYGPSICGDCIDTLEDGTILTGSYRDSNQLELWDFKTMKCRKHILWNGSENCEIACVYTTAFNNVKDGDDRLILGGCSRLNEVKLFNQRRDWLPCATIPMKSGVYSVDFANHSNLFAFGGMDKKVYLMNVRNR